MSGYDEEQPPPLPAQPMHVLAPAPEPAEDVPCDHDRTYSDRRLCSATEETRCVDCGRTVDTTGEPTVDDLADVPIWRYEPPAEECDHPVTVTKRLDIVQPIPGDPFNVHVIGQTTDAVTACLTCHHLAPAREDHP